MFRFAPTDVPAGRGPARGALRTVHALAAAVTVGAALTGCTVAVDGASQTAQHPVARSTPQTSQPATFPPRAEEDRILRSTAGTQPLLLGSDEDLAPHMDVLAQWIDDGWVQTPLLRQTDPDTGVSAAMFGSATESTSSEGVRSFKAEGAPDGIFSTFGIARSDAGSRESGEAFVRRAATKMPGGRLVSTDRVTADGRPAVDARIEVRTSTGTDLVLLMRRVELPDHLVLVQSFGPAAGTVVEQVQQIVTSTLTAP